MEQQKKEMEQQKKEMEKRMQREMKQMRENMDKMKTSDATTMKKSEVKVLFPEADSTYY